VRLHTREEHRRLYLQVRLVIERHYAKQLTVRVVARALATSPRQVQRAYERFGECTFREDLVRRRMLVAAELLAQQAIPVADVARLVGYRQPSHFSKAFRSRYGIAPARFRVELRAHRDSAAMRGGAATKPAILSAGAPVSAQRQITHIH
jgi:two-component system response regulator YesN